MEEDVVDVVRNLTQYSLSLYAFSLCVKGKRLNQVQGTNQEERNTRQDD